MAGEDQSESLGGAPSTSAATAENVSGHAAAEKAAEKAAGAYDHEYVVYKPLVSVRPKKETVTEDVEIGG